MWCSVTLVAATALPLDATQIKFTKKTKLPFDEIHVEAAFEAMLCVTPSNKHKTLVRWYDKACAEAPRSSVDKLLDKLCLQMAKDDLDESTAPIREALREIPSFILGFDKVIEGFLDQVLRKLMREAWQQQEEMSKASIKQRMVDAMYGGGWA